MGRSRAFVLVMINRQPRGAAGKFKKFQPGKIVFIEDVLFLGKNLTTSSNIFICKSEQCTNGMLIAIHSNHSRFIAPIGGYSIPIGLGITGGHLIRAGCGNFPINVKGTTKNAAK